MGRNIDRVRRRCGILSNYLFRVAVSEPVVKPVVQPGLTTVLNEQPFDNRLNVCLHDITGCTTGLTTGCIV